MSNLSSDAIKTNRIPFVIGAAGHRDICPADVPELLKRTQSVIRSIMERMPNTPLLLLSGLAEGADQLIAQAALLEGANVAAVLPMPIETYRAQLSQEALLKFNKLLDSCLFTLELQNTGLSESGLQSSASYERLAHFLACHSQALIALWDGFDSGKAGGTSDVVRFVLEGHPGGGLLGHEPQRGIVYQIVTPRQSGSKPEDAATLRVLTYEDADKEAPKSMLRRLKHRRKPNLLERNIEQFNCDAKNHPGTGDRRLLISSDGTGLNSSFVRRVSDLFDQADGLAVHASKLRSRYFIAILSLAFLGTLAFAIHEDLVPRSLGLWLMLPGCVFAASLIHRTAKASNIEERYLDARSLAEALRVQFFWELAGIDKAVADFYLVRHRSELDWIRSALRGLWLFRLAYPEPAHRTADIPAVLSDWINHQRRWYQTCGQRQKRAMEAREQIAHFALWFLVIWSLIIPAAILVHLPWQTLRSLQLVLQSEPWYGMLHFVLVIPALVAGVYRLWTEQSGFEEQAREYLRIARFLNWQSKLLSSSLDDPSKAREIIIATGIEALEENGRWLLLHRDRPLQVFSSP